MNFKQALDEWYAHDEWRYADREASYKFFFNLGRGPNVLSYVGLLREAEESALAEPEMNDGLSTLF